MFSFCVKFFFVSTSSHKRKKIYSFKTIYGSLKMIYIECHTRTKTNTVFIVFLYDRIILLIKVNIHNMYVITNEIDYNKNEIDQKSS